MLTTTYHCYQYFYPRFRPNDSRSCHFRLYILLAKGGGGLVMGFCHMRIFETDNKAILTTPSHYHPLVGHHFRPNGSRS